MTFASSSSLANSNFCQHVVFPALLHLRLWTAQVIRFIIFIFCYSLSVRSSVSTAWHEHLGLVLWYKGCDIYLTSVLNNIRDFVRMFWLILEVTVMRAYIFSFIFSNAQDSSESCWTFCNCYHMSHETITVIKIGHNFHISPSLIHSCSFLIQRILLE